MGKNFIRQLDKERKWTDKSAVKHKHDFSVDAIVQLRNKNFIFYYRVTKCSCCNSFIDAKIIPHDEEIDYSLPLIKLYRSHQSIGIRDAILDDGIR
jgi:hypothetical protein